MENAEGIHIGGRKKNRTNKQYHFHGSRVLKIPSSTLRYWKSKQKLKESKAARNLGHEIKNQEDNLPQVENSEIEMIARDTPTEAESGTVENSEIEVTACDTPTETEPGTVFQDTFMGSCSAAIDDDVPIATPNSPNPNPMATVHDGRSHLLYPNEVLTQSLLILTTKWRHNLTYAATEDIAQLHSVLGNSTTTHATKYNWKKIVDNVSSQMRIHHLCPKCKCYIGESAEESIHCDQCNEDIDTKSNIKLHNIFIYMSLTQHLKEVFETTDAHENLVTENRQKMCQYAIEDIFDGKMYKKLMATSMISVNFNVDGVPIFDSSNSSIWPILCTINELLLTKRRSNVLLCSVWFGSGKPKMAEYLKPFVKECKTLLSEGFDYEFKGSRYNRKCRALMCISDSVARPLLRNSHQFNGAYGCGLCLHPGETIPKGNGFTRVYPLGAEKEPFGEGLRTDAETHRHAETHEKGIKGQSILREIPDFDVIECLDADWMHCVALGVCRQFASLWFDSLNHAEEFYFGRSIEAVDNLLRSYTPDAEISRTPRAMSDRTNWKAHEWTIFLLFYSLPILQELFPKKYVKHWALLVDGISTLLKTKIMPEEIQDSYQCLIDFIEGVETYYGRKHLSFNVHLLAHLPRSVSNWGPLWTHSAFPYANANQDLLNSVNSSNGVVLQICDIFRVKCAVDKLYKEYSHTMTGPQMKYLHKLLGKEDKMQPSLIVDNAGMLGSPKHLNELPLEQFLALQRLNIDVDEKSIILYYNRAIVNSVMFHSKSYSRVEKRASYYAIIQTDEVFEIHSFLVLMINSCRSCFAVGKYFQRSNDSFIRGRKLSHLVLLPERYDSLAAVNISMLKEQVTTIRISDSERFVACVHPNHYELLS